MITDWKAFGKAANDITDERKNQPPFDDSENTEGCWVAYIVNYVSRWALPRTFSKEKYNFRTCMVKVAALAIAAIEWYDSCNGAPCTLDSTQAEKVLKPLEENDD